MKIGVSDARLEVMIVLSKEGNRGLRQSESVFVYFVFSTLFSSLPFGFHLFLFFFFHFFWPSLEIFSMLWQWWRAVSAQ